MELDGTSDAKVISYEEYHPYGTTAYQAINRDIKSAAKRYRYTGMERDEESGISYHSARYYLPWLGRWVNADPIGIGDGLNIFSYASNNPVSHIDPNGQTSKLSKTGGTPVKSNLDLTLELITKVHDEVMLGYDKENYHCLDQAQNYVLNLMTGTYYTKGSEIKKKFNKLINDGDVDVVYDIKKEMPGSSIPGWTSKVFIRPNDPHGRKRFGKNVGMVDKLVYFPKKNASNLAEGWYIKREKFEKRAGVYKKIGEELVKKTLMLNGKPLMVNGKPLKVHVKIENGDVLYTAQGEHGSDFDLRHKVFVFIKGKNIEFFGAYGRGRGGEEESSSGTLLLKVRNQTGSPHFMSFARRIITKVLRSDYSKAKKL